MISYAVQLNTFTPYAPLRQDMIYEPCEPLTRSKVVTEMPFPRIATLLRMKLEDVITGLEQMIAGAPGKHNQVDMVT